MRGLPTCPPDAPRILAGDPDAWSALDRCVAALPPGCRMLLAGRAVPPLPALTRIRLDGDLLALGPRKLGFTPEESAALLARLGAAGQAEAALAEGWPVALRLLALDGAGRPGADPADRESRLGEAMAYVAREVAPAVGELRLLADLSAIDNWNQEVVSGLLERRTAWSCWAPGQTSCRRTGTAGSTPWSAATSGRCRTRTMPGAADSGAAALLAFRLEAWAQALRHALAAGDVGLAAPLLQRVVEADLVADRLAEADALIPGAPKAVWEVMPDQLPAAPEAP